VSALVSELPRVNGWSIARHSRDRTPDRTQRLLNHASWDTSAAMSVVRQFAAKGLDAAARRRAGMVIGAIDETGQEKAGEATSGVKRQYMGCAGRVANGINTVHLSYVRDKTGHALIGARQWIPREHIADPVKSLLMGLPPDLAFRTKGQLAIDICAAAYADGIRFDVTCGDEVYGSCTQLREFFEDSNQAYVLRVPSNFTLTLAASTKLTCAQAVKALLKDKRRWEIRSAGHGSKGERWYAWAWLATASPRHHLLVRRHLKTGELAFHYCYVPEGQLLTKTRLIGAAGLRWPVEVGHRCYLSSGICLSRLPSLSFFLRFAGFCLGWCPAGVGVVAGRAVPALAELAHLLLAGGDDPVPAPGCAAGGDPAAVDPVVDAGGGHAELGGQSRDGPLARVQVREDGGPALGILADGVLADDVADLLAGEDRGALGRPVSRGVERAGDLPAVPPLAGEPGDGLQEGRVVGELVQAADRADGSPAGPVPAGPGDVHVHDLAVPVDGHGDAVDEDAEEFLAVGAGSRRSAPDPGQVRGQGLERVAFCGRQGGGALLGEPLVLGL
jgi:hypothetical protein